MQKISRRLSRDAFSCILVFASLTSSIGASGRLTIARTQRADRTVGKGNKTTKLTLPIDRIDPAIVNPEGLDLTFTDEVIARETDVNVIRLAVREMRVSRSEELPRLLESGGIRWSAKSISLIYDLNPELVDIRAVPEQTLLLLPNISGDSLLERLKAQGPIVILSSKEQQPNKLVRAEQESLGKLSRLLQKIPLFHFKKPEVKSTLIKLVESARLSLSFLGGDKSSAAQRVLNQSALEADRLEKIVSEGLTNNRVGNSSIQKEVFDLSQAITNRRHEIRVGGSALVKVEVQTVKKDDRPIPGLRIFYRPELDREEKYVQKFRIPSTPTSEGLPLGGRFVLWAGEGDNPKPLSDHQTITVGSNNNDPVKLIVQE